MKSIGLPVEDMDNLFRVMGLDESSHVTAEEFAKCCLAVRNCTRNIDLYLLVKENIKMLDQLVTQLNTMPKVVAAATGRASVLYDDSGRRMSMGRLQQAPTAVVV